jgi:carbonic anhydrase
VIVKKPIDTKHQTDNLVITCIDHRFQRAISDVLKKRGVDIHTADRLAFPGCSSAVADGNLTDSVKISSKLHDIKNVWLVDHLDCGAFGGLAAYANSAAKETGAHASSLAKAKQVINQCLPELKVQTLIVGLDGNEVIQ